MLCLFLLRLVVWARQPPSLRWQPTSLRVMHGAWTLFRGGRCWFFCIEESQDELNRKYGASVRSWSAAERSQAEENLRLISCVDRDTRLTRIVGRQVDGSGVSDQIIRTATDFGAEVIVLDHLQGFVSGDLN